MGAKVLWNKEKIGGEVKMAKVVKMKGTEEKMEDKFKSAMVKTGKGLSIFGAAFVKQATSVDTIATGAGVGLVQGMKYNGSIERGIKAGLGYVASMGAINGVVNVVKNWDVITED